MTIGQGLAGGIGDGFAALFISSGNSGGQFQVSDFGVLVQGFNLTGKQGADINAFKNIKTTKDGSMEAGMSFELTGIDQGSGGWKAVVRNNEAWDDFDGDGSYKYMVRIEGSPTGFTNATNQTYGTIIDGWGVFDTSKTSFRGTVQAKDFLDENGDSIIYEYKDPEWSNMSEAAAQPTLATTIKALGRTALRLVIAH